LRGGQKTPCGSGRVGKRTIFERSDFIRCPAGPRRSRRAHCRPRKRAEQRKGGGLTLEPHSRLFSFTTPDGRTERVRALTIFLVNRRAIVHRYYADASYAFQARLELARENGFRPRHDLSGYRATDWDLRIADLHYRDVCEWAVGRNATAGWDPAEDCAGIVRRVWTDPPPTAEAERVAWAITVNERRTAHRRYRSTPSAIRQTAFDR
jgi:hypothetical protein